MQTFKDTVTRVFLILSVMLSLLALAGIYGCDEGAQIVKPAMNEMMDDGAKNPPETDVEKTEKPVKPPTTVGEMKQEMTDAGGIAAEDPVEVPAEGATDTLPPTVTTVTYYRDWQLTEVLTAADIVRPGDIIYAKVVFSEPVVHVVGNDSNARPALSIVIDAQATRFYVAAHGARGEDFLSGACKPLHSGTDDYVCKIAIPAKAATLALQVEAETADTAGNAVAAVSVHQVPFSIAIPMVEPLTIVSITHYRNDSDEPIPEGASVDAGTTITTEIVFSVPVQANSIVISYPKGHRTEHLSHATGVHWRGTYQISADGTVVRSKLDALEEVFSLVVEQAASLDGSVLQQPTAAPELSVVRRARPAEPVPPEVLIVPDMEPAVGEPWEPATDEFTTAEIEEYRAIHAMVFEISEILGNTQDPLVHAREYLVWDFVAGISITIHELVYLDVIYRNHYPGITAEQGTDMQFAKQMEYLRIKLAYPESAAEETLEIYTASVKNGIVDRIRTDLLDDEWGAYFIK